MVVDFAITAPYTHHQPRDLCSRGTRILGVYTFSGITMGLGSSDIHRNAYRYNVSANTRTALPDVPDTLGKIAAAASVVGDTAYVIGGYHVLNGPPYEVSSNRVHRLDLSTDTWMPNGANIPVPIDDQVQAVWRDSLIYVIKAGAITPFRNS